MSDDWPARAACKTEPHAWWFPVGATNDERARRICATCPVQEPCLEFAIRTDQRFGIWAGMSFEERKRDPDRRVVYCQQCGTRFTWRPAVEGDRLPRFCTARCRRASENTGRRRREALQ